MPRNKFDTTSNAGSSYRALSVPSYFSLSVSLCAKHKSENKQLQKCDALVDVEVEFHLLVLDELHDEVGVSRLSLSNRRIDVDDELTVNVVGFGEEVKFLNLAECDSVVVRLASQAQEVGMQIYICCM